MTDSANRGRTEPRESQVLLCRPSEVWGDAAYIVSIRHTFILYLLRIYIVVITAGGEALKCFLSVLSQGMRALAQGHILIVGSLFPARVT